MAQSIVHEIQVEVVTGLARGWDPFLKALQPLDATGSALSGIFFASLAFTLAFFFLGPTGRAFAQTFFLFLFSSSSPQTHSPKSNPPSPTSPSKPKKKKNNPTQSPQGAGHYYSLTFTLAFEHPGDVSLVAMCYPYTYGRLQRFLSEACDSPPPVGTSPSPSPAASTPSRGICKRELLCRTLGGLRCDVVTVTDFGAPQAEVAARPAVVFSARVHPGEVVASHMMEGTLKFLLGPSALAKLLRR